MLHYFAVALIIVAVLCFLAVPVLGASLFVIGILIETIGYVVWGADFWNRQRAKQASANNEGP
jgi:hypothetical protein